ncbi:unnamed protein product [Urochloa humidicola]
MFGATQRVDMITTRKNDYGRYKVAVLNPKEVPTEMDVVIGYCFFELKFSIEPFENVQDLENKAVAPMNEDDDESRGNEDAEMEECNKNPKHTPDGSSSKNATTQNIGASASGGPVADGEMEDWEDEDDLFDDMWGTMDDHLAEGQVFSVLPVGAVRVAPERWEEQLETSTGVGLESAQGLVKDVLPQEEVVMTDSISMSDEKQGAAIHEMAPLLVSDTETHVNEEKQSIS